VGEQGREGWTFLDAWETGGDGSPGSTMMKTNPSSVPLLRPISGGTISSWTGHPGLAELGTRCTHPGTEGGAGAHAVQRVVW